MLKLINCYMSDFLERMRVIKDFYDEGSHRTAEFFSGYNEDEELYETGSFEDMMSIPEFRDYDELYFENEDGYVDEDESPYGEVWTFSSSDMAEYYRLLKRLLKTKRITKKTYDLKLNEMEKYVVEYITNAQLHYYSNIYAELDCGKEKKSDCSIRIYLDYDSCYSAFVLVCGILTLFDKYTQKLKELKEEYGSNETLSEAA